MAEDAGAAEQAPEGGATPAAPEPELLEGCPVSYSRGQRVLHVGRSELLGVVGKLRDAGWVTLVDLTAVDYLLYAPPRLLPEGIEPERFEVVTTLATHNDPERLRLRIQVPEADATVPSLFELFPGSEALEREVFDLFGISFSDHPDLTRILMPEDWDGHPLRKDYAVGRIPVQFKGDPGPR